MEYHDDEKWRVVDTCVMDGIVNNKDHGVFIPVLGVAP